MKAFLALMVLLLLSGCATGNFENRITCTADRKEAFFVSKYWKIAVGSEIAKSDTEVICR